MQKMFLASLHSGTATSSGLTMRKLHKQRQPVRGPAVGALDAELARIPAAKSIPVLVRAQLSI